MNGTKKALLLLLGMGSIAEVVEGARSLHHIWWAPIAFFAAYALFDVLFIPTQVLSVAAAVIWGWRLGGTIELFAATSGAILPWLIARKVRPARAMKYREMLEREGFTFLLVLRLVPIVPYTALNYAAGLSPIRLGPYVVATLIGVIPSTYIFAFFVDSIATGVVQPRDVFWRIVLAGALVAALVVITRLASAGIRRRTARPPDVADRAAE